jgi:hypothetical protein
MDEHATEKIKRHLTEALESTDDDGARYNIRSAAQLVDAQQVLGDGPEDVPPEEE